MIGFDGMIGVWGVICLLGLSQALSYHSAHLPYHSQSRQEHTDDYCENGELMETEDCVSFRLCSDNVWTSQSCTNPDIDKDLVASTACAACTKQADEAVHECMRGATKCARWSCAVFARCTPQSRWQWMQCSAPLLWSEQHQACTLHSECKLPNNKHNECKHQHRIAQYDNDNECDKYFECVHGQWAIFTCPAGQIYDTASGQCVVFSGSCEEWLVSAFEPQQPFDAHDNRVDEPQQQQAPVKQADHQDDRRCEIGSTMRNDYDCSLYYVCTGKDYSLCRCPDKTSFNSLQGRCDRSNQCDLSHCVDGGTKPSRTCGQYSVCVKGIWKWQKCPRGMRFEHGFCQGQCQNQPERAHCDEGTAFAEDVDCSHYLVCYRGQFERRRCQYGAAFDPEVGYCRNEYKCPNSVDPAPICHGDETREIQGECRDFMLCVHGSFKKRSCPEGSKYWPDSHGCTPGYCFKSQLIPPPNSVPDPLPNPSPNFIHHKCKESPGPPGFRADPYDRNKFYQCAQGRWVAKKCPSTLVWDSAITNCNWP